MVMFPLTLQKQINKQIKQNKTTKTTKKTLQIFKLDDLPYLPFRLPYRNVLILGDYIYFLLFSVSVQLVLYLGSCLLC